MNEPWEFGKDFHVLERFICGDQVLELVYDPFDKKHNNYLVAARTISGDDLHACGLWHRLKESAEEAFNEEKRELLVKAYVQNVHNGDYA